MREVLYLGNDFIEVKIRLKRSTMDSLEKIVQYFNMREKIINSERKHDLITVEEMMRGAIVREIEKIETYNHLIVHEESNSILGQKFELKNRLKEVLSEKGMKQLDLCELTGIDRSTISTIVNNRSQPTADSLLRIWVALDFYPLDQLFYREKC